jgi:hypothetical protein
MKNATGRITSVLLTLFILILTSMGVLRVFGVISMDTLADSAAKIGASFLIIVVATGLIALIQNVHDK